MPATCSTPTLLEYGFAKGHYQARPDDGLKLVDCRISNAVRCVPPQNKPLPVEINTCRRFLGRGDRRPCRGCAPSSRSAASRMRRR